MLRLNLLEVLIVLWLAWTTWRIMRNPFRLNLIRTGVMALGLGSAILLDQPLAAFLGATCDNFMTSLTLLIFFSLWIYFLVVRFANRVVNAVIWTPLPTGSATFRNRAMNLILVVMLYVGVAVVTDFLAGLAAMGPLSHDIRKHSLIFRFFLPQEEIPSPSLPVDSEVAEPNRSTFVDAMDKQAHFLSALRGGINSSRKALAKSLGTQAATDQIRSLVVLLNLPPEDTLWLIDNTPELKRLVDNPRILNIMSNDTIITMIVEAGEGSVPALYRLGEDPSIKALFDDPDVVASIKAISLPQLQMAAEQHRESTKQAMHVTWLMADIDLTTDMQTALNDPGRWTLVDDMRNTVTWNDLQRFVLLKATVSCTLPTTATLSVQCNGPVIGWCNDVAQEFTSNLGRSECRLGLGAEPTTLVLMIDFRNATPPKQCQVRVLKR